MMALKSYDGAVYCLELGKGSNAKKCNNKE